jgi:hypothetical protein
MPTVYNNEPVLVVSGRSVGKKFAEAIRDLQNEGWTVFDPPFNCVYTNKNRVGPAGGRVACYMRRTDAGVPFYTQEPAALALAAERG